MLAPGQIYMPPGKEKRGISEGVRELTDLMMQMKMKEYLLQKQADIEATKQKEVLGEKYRLQGEYGGTVNIVDPETGEIKTIYAPGQKGGKTFMGRAPKAPPRMTEKDIELIGGQKMQQAAGETGELGGIAGLLERFMPFGAKARERGIMRRGEELMQPYTQRFQEQFQPGGAAPGPAAAPAASTAPPVKEGKIVGRFTGGAQEAQPQDPRIQQRIAELRTQGISDEEIASDLREINIDPTIYGLK